MNTTKQKSKKPATEVLEIDLSIEKKTTINDSEPSLIAESHEDSKIKEVVETVNSAVNPSIKKSKTVKTKVIRDSFSFPEQDYLKISELKKTVWQLEFMLRKAKFFEQASIYLQN